MCFPVLGLNTSPILYKISRAVANRGIHSREAVDVDQSMYPQRPELLRGCNLVVFLTTPLKLSPDTNHAKSYALREERHEVPCLEIHLKVLRPISGPRH